MENENAIMSSIVPSTPTSDKDDIYRRTDSKDKQEVEHVEILHGDAANNDIDDHDLLFVRVTHDRQRQVASTRLKSYWSFHDTQNENIVRAEAEDKMTPFLAFLIATVSSRRCDSEMSGILWLCMRTTGRHCGFPLGLRYRDRRNGITYGWHRPRACPL
jgi:hypothetical protein